MIERLDRLQGMETEARFEGWRIAERDQPPDWNPGEPDDAVQDAVKLIGPNGNDTYRT